MPAAVAVPQDPADLIALVAWARREKASLVPRGAGSAVTGSSVGEGVMVDIAWLEPRTLEVDHHSQTARVGAAVRLAEINAKAASHGLRLPPDPSSGAFATTGGVVSTNASGARSVRYGSVRPWVQAVSFISADGEPVILTRGEAPPPAAAVGRFQAEADPAIRAAAGLIRQRRPATRKNSFGYALDDYLRSGDLVDLLIGAEGTLGLITEVRWKLAPLPSHRAGIRVVLAQLDHLTDAVEALLPLDPSAIELLDRTFLDLVGDGSGAAGSGFKGEAVLLVEFEGEDPTALRGTVGDAVRRMKHLAADVETAVTPAEEARLWALRHAASPIIARLPEERRSLQVIEDACVPVSRMGEYIGFVREAAASQGIPVVIFGNAGDGNIHVNVLPDVTRPGWEGAVGRLFESVTDEVFRLGGTPSGEHGVGRLRAGLLERMCGAEIVALFRKVKHAFDPEGILNPGVLLDGRGPLERLKVGASAAPIPADIETGLREIERNGGYARRRLELAGPG